MEYTTKILIADENAAHRATIRECFMRAGCRNIDEAQNGEDALSRINRTHPDIVIIDIWMSKLDGLSVVRSAKATVYGNDKPPVIIMTSPISNQNIFVQALQAGADLCLVKPINQSNLLEYAENMLAEKIAEALRGIGGKSDVLIHVEGVYPLPRDLLVRGKGGKHLVLGGGGGKDHANALLHRKTREDLFFDVGCRRPAHLGAALVDVDRQAVAGVCFHVISSLNFSTASVKAALSSSYL